MASTSTKTANLIRWKIDVASTGAQDSTKIAITDVSPFRAGGPLILRLDALDGTAIFKLQQAPRYDSATGAAPATGSSLWTDLKSWDTTDATTALTSEVTLAEDTYYVRANVTTAHAASFAIVNITAPGA